MKRQKRSRVWQIDKIEFAKLVAESLSISEILRKLNLCHSGFKTVVARIKEDNLDYSHLPIGGATRYYGYTKEAIPLSDVLVEHSTYNRYHLKNRLLKEGLLDNKCAICGLEPTWQNKVLVLVLDHENGIRDDSRLFNLRLLCPNCNSQTNTFSGRNGGRSSKVE